MGALSLGQPTHCSLLMTFPNFSTEIPTSVKPLSPGQTMLVGYPTDST